MNLTNEATAINAAVLKLGSITEKVTTDYPEVVPREEVLRLVGTLVEVTGQIGLTLRDLLTELAGLRDEP